MLKEIGYDREKTLAYAKKWALARNPAYYDFETLGGDCTNFASQCVLAGCSVMNYTPVFGWFYINAGNRTASWTGVEYFYDFLTNNRGVGPYARETSFAGAEVGDIVQLGDVNGRFYHSPVIVDIKDGEALLAAHTYDAYMRPLSDYSYQTVRFIHILGSRDWA